MKNPLFLILSFLLVLPVAAQTTPAPNRVRGNVNFRTETKQEIQDMGQNVQEQAQKARADFQKTVETRLTELQGRIQAHRDELKIKLQKIKDERKKTVVERIDQSITDLNSRMTAHYANVLNQIDDVLNRIISRTDKAQANGEDVTAVRMAITNAQNAIAAARAAVTAQAGKIYSINITTDAKLRSDVGASRQALHTDLKKVEDSVKAARDAVRQAAVSLAQIRGVDELKTPTSTATSTNQ